MKNIAFAIPNFRGGGAENVIVNLANYFTNKYKVHLIVLIKDGPNLLKVNKEIYIHDMKYSSSIKSIFRIKEIILENNIDVIVGTLAMAHAISLLKLIGPSNCKYIARLGNTISYDLENYSFFKKVIMKQYQKVLQFSDLIICQSKGMQKDLNNYINIKNTVVIYNPIDLQKIYEKSIQSKDLKIDSDYFNIISVGRLSYQKDYKTSLLAFKKFNEKFDKSRYYILGEGIEFDTLVEFTKELKLEESVFFLGYVENPYPYIKDSDILLLTSLYEGFSNVILESLSLSIPVVATNSPGGNSEIIINGINGFLSPLQNPEKIAIDMEKIKNSTGFNICTDRYQIKNIGAEYEKNFN